MNTRRSNHTRAFASPLFAMSLIILLLSNHIGASAMPPAACAELDFLPPNIIDIHAGALDVAVIDFNADGKPDLATANRDSDDVTVLLGDGGGNFTPAPNSPFNAGDTPLSITSADFNADGKPDIAVGNANGDIFGSQAITVLLGDGGGDFTQTTVPAFPYSPVQVFDVAAGDLNMDGKPDLVATNTSFAEVSVMFGNGSGGFIGPAGYYIGGAIPVFLEVADFNLDGKPDVATSNTGNSVTLMLGDGAGYLTEAPGSPFAVGNFPGDLAVGNFNQDAAPDIAVANFLSKDVSILIGDGNGGFNKTEIYIGGTVADVKARDFNLDGALDLLIAGTTAPNGSTMGIVLGDGNGGFGPVGNINLNGNATYSPGTGDFNADGKLDIVAPYPEAGFVAIFINGCEECSGPTISGASVDQAVLWPPNHTMRDVIVNYTVAGGCGAVTSNLTVTSNEPVTGAGGGDTSPDCEVVGPNQVRLRAERAGSQGGRVYTITITATDEAGNTATATVMVSVPHNQVAAQLP